MALSELDHQNIVTGNRTGRRRLDEFAPSKLAVGDTAEPQGTQAALTTSDATVIDATYGAPEEGVLNNVRTRLDELEARLQAAGFIA